MKDTTEEEVEVSEWARTAAINANPNRFLARFVRL